MRPRRNLPPWLEIAPAVAHALSRQRAVVAFESTVIAHGLPRPLNLEVAERMEEVAREEGCVPATIGIIAGKMHIGLTDEMRKHLANSEDVAKVNLSNLPTILTFKRDGATTVATTMLGCDLAGIEVFATGGIGGVHPAAGETFDISADLTALTQSRVTVVSAGAKAILDIPATLEALETRGVPVIGMRTDRFPTFYRSSSDHLVDGRVENVEQAARLITAHRTNPHAAGILIANPIPEADALSQELVDEALAKAGAEALTEGIRGRALTPFLLAAMERHTGSASLQANCALLENNARIGAQLAKALEILKL